MADTAPTRASLKAAAAATVPTEMSATARQLATEESHHLPHHLCGPDTARTTARTKVLNVTGCSADANFAMVAAVAVVAADADSAAVAAAAVDALAIQTADAVADLPTVAVADLPTALDLLAIAVAEPLTSAPFVADISAVADVA